MGISGDQSIPVINAKDYELRKNTSPGPEKNIRTGQFRIFLMGPGRMTSKENAITVHQKVLRVKRSELRLEVRKIHTELHPMSS